MEIPICFSQYFVNKQNVRSFRNIFNAKLLKMDNIDEFCRNVLQDRVSEISPELREVLMELRNNILKYCQDDFKKHFEPPKQCKILSCVDKVFILKESSTLLFKIVPKTLFGNNHNSKIFYKCLKTIVYSMKKQHFIFSRFINTWNYDVGLWNCFGCNNAHNIVLTLIVWILKNILSAIISLNFYVTTCKIDADENKLYYFWKHQWQRFYDKQTHKLVVGRGLSKYLPYSLGHRVKKRFSLQQRASIGNIRKTIPKLHLILKPNNEVRPIVRYKNGSLSNSEKIKIRERLKFLRLLNGRRCKLETQFSILHSNWLERNKPKLYFVKADLRNAFGCVDMSLLRKVITAKMEEFLKSSNHFDRNKYIILCKELLAELQKPLLVRIGSTIYTWKSGLVQGYVYSPALSELYYSNLDKHYFSHLNPNEGQLNFFTRVVDDYLYITDSLDDAHMFLESLTKYKNVNYSKTAVNFEYAGIKYCDVIQFLGYTYNTDNLVVNRASNIYSGQMCYKITFSSSISNINTFLESRIGRTGIPINSLLFNFNNMNEEIVWQHIFVTYCIAANKLCTILSILCEEGEMVKHLHIYKQYVGVKLTNSIIDVLLRNKPKDFMFMYCINHFRYLSYKALLLCAKNTPKCNKLVAHVNVEMAKCNCIFGNWREHASVINKNGDSQKSALKIICRRTDLRKIIKNFEKLPTGFQCFKNMYV